MPLRCQRREERRAYQGLGAIHNAGFLLEKHRYSAFQRFPVRGWEDVAHGGS